MAITINIETPGEGIAVLHVAGRLDAATAADFEAALLPQAENPAVQRVVLDFSGLEYVASAGLRVFLKAVKAVAPRKAKLYVTGANDMVTSVLKMTGFLAYVTVRPTLDACLA